MAKEKKKRQNINKKSRAKKNELKTPKRQAGQSTGGWRGGVGGGGERHTCDSKANNEAPERGFIASTMPRDHAQISPLRLRLATLLFPPLGRGTMVLLWRGSTPVRRDKLWR